MLDLDVHDLMSNTKLQKRGNSFGFKVSTTDLEAAGFDKSSDYEIIAQEGFILFAKKRPHASKWVFKDPALSKNGWSQV